MSNCQIYLRAIAIAVLFYGCQPTPSNPPKDLTSTNPITEKAINYLRSQFNLSSNVAIVMESQQPQPANISDLCQISAPTQDGFSIALVAEERRYTLQTNLDASKIEICHSEDAKPETTVKYIGAGYVLHYPARWKVIDLGLEASGASTVIFTSSLDKSLGLERDDLAKLLQNLQQIQQPYTIVAKLPIGSSIAFDSLGNNSASVKDLANIPFDVTVKGAKSALKQDFTLIKGFNNSFEKTTVWKVKVLNLETNRFLYTIRSYQPNARTNSQIDSQNDSNNSSAKTFDQFANSFALIE